jgi:hypothetical protein
MSSKSPALSLKRRLKQLVFAGARRGGLREFREGEGGESGDIYD